MEIKCYKCGKNTGLTTPFNISRSELCPHCYANIHSCMMCEFYDKSAYNECREPVADRITDKEKANFCDYFKLTNKSKTQESKDEALNRANALFKK